MGWDVLLTFTDPLGYGRREKETIVSTVIICEKPKQAENIRKALGGGVGRVVALSGHVIELKEPHEVREEWKRWTTDLLWPDGMFGHKVSKTKKTAFENVKAALKTANKVIVATDADREGQLIADEVLDYLKFKGDVQRVLFNAEDEESLQKAFAAPRPNAEFRSWSQAAVARQQADQMSNLTLTRTATVKFMASGAKSAIGIGRVKTPVMSLICQREDERINFKPQTFFEITANTQVASGALDFTCRGMPKSLVSEEEKADEAEEQGDGSEDEAALAELEPLRGKIMSKDDAQKLADSVQGSTPKILMTSKRQVQTPPKLFDLATLQAAATKKFGFTSSRTLELAQSLYDTYKVTTYPRAESLYMPEVEIKNVGKLVGALLQTDPYERYGELLSKPEARTGKNGHFSDKHMEGLSHHAIIPNVAVANDMPGIVAGLPKDEAKLFDLIARRYLSAVAPDYVYQKTEAWFFHAYGKAQNGADHEWKFSASGSVPITQGWKEIAGIKSEGTELPAIQNGEIGKVISTKLNAKQTSPRPRFDDGTIILAMKQPWLFADKATASPVLIAMLKESEGIGRPSTRDKFVDGLVEQGLIVRQKKELVPTPSGMRLWKLLSKVTPQLTDVVRTGVWESLFKRVHKGELTADQAIQKIIEETVKERDKLIKAAEGFKDKIGTAAPPSPKAVMFAQKLAEMKGLALDKSKLKDREYVYKFLEDNAPKEGESLPPSPKQLAFAQSLAERMGKQIPPEAMKDGKLMKSWLDEAVATAPPSPPSNKALEFAEKIAESIGVPLPENAKTSSKACSEFINANKDKAGGSGGGGGGLTGAPTEKALGFAQSIAETKGIPLPEAAKTSAQACSEFINAHKSGGGGKSSGAKKPYTKSRSRK